MPKKAAQILSETVGGRFGNSIVDVIQANSSLTDGDQLSMFVNRNRSLIKEFILVICGFIIFILIILFFIILTTILFNQYSMETQRKEYEAILLSNFDIRTRYVTNTSKNQ
jgi:hypothetical protein